MNVDYLIQAGYLITMDKDLNMIRNGCVAVKDGEVIDTGTFGELSSRYSPQKVLGDKDKALLPGLINTHTHAAMVYFRGLADDLPLKEWLEDYIWPSEAKWLSEEFVRDAMELACLEMLKAGITTFNDMYFFVDTASMVVKSLGIRAVMGPGILDFPTPGGKDRDEYLKRAEDFILRWKGDTHITPSVAPHAIYTCSKETLQMAKSLAMKYNLTIHIHLSETEWEVQESIKKHNMRPVHYLDSFGFLDSNIISAHAVHLDKSEIEVFAEREVKVSHCVESNLKLASGIAPVKDMLRHGVKVTFGTDSAASNNDLNLLSELSTAAKLHKAISGDPTILDARTALLMATRWAGEALGLGDMIGSIEKGKRADLVMIDLNKPHLLPVYDIYSHIVYASRPSDICMVMVDGRILVNDGRLTIKDEDEILNKAKAWGMRIYQGRPHS